MGGDRTVFVVSNYLIMSNGGVVSVKECVWDEGFALYGMVR